MNLRLSAFVLCAGILTALTGCIHRAVRVPKTATVAPQDNSYLDLKPGGTLRILVPLLKSKGSLTTVVSSSQEAKTISVAAPDFVGYEVSYYTITGGSSGVVKLKFKSAEISRNRKTVQEPNPPALPFNLPRGPAHIRLVYLIRASQADHNMAILASKQLAALNAFTKQLKQSPTVCGEDQQVFCTWVPSGVAVRPEGG